MIQASYAVLGQLLFISVTLNMPLFSKELWWRFLALICYSCHVREIYCYSAITKKIPDSLFSTFPKIGCLKVLTQKKPFHKFDISSSNVAGL